MNYDKLTLSLHLCLPLPLSLSLIHSSTPPSLVPFVTLSSRPFISPPPPTLSHTLPVPTYYIYVLHIKKNMQSQHHLYTNIINN